MQHKKLLFALIASGAMLATLSAIGFLSIQPAHAQCGTQEKSTCFTCHARQDPVQEQGEWHVVHAGKDLCINCHGGNGTSKDAAAAHQGMTTNPLSDVYTDCHSCHPDDYSMRAQRFANTLGVKVGSCATPTPVAAMAVSYNSLVIQPVPAANAVQRPSMPSMIFGASVLLFGIWLVVTLILRRM
jgi:hypothetical protein